MTFSDYVIVSQVGSGSQGIVYKVHHKHSGQIYAMKCIDICQMSQKEQKSLQKEIKVLSALRKHPHPYVMTYMESFIDTEQNVMCLILEWNNEGTVQDLFDARVAQKYYFLANENEDIIHTNHNTFKEKSNDNQNLFKEEPNGGKIAIPIIDNNDYNTRKGDVVKHLAKRTTPARDRLACYSVFSEDEIWTVFLSIASALEHIHSLHILHRDVKMSNVLLHSNVYDSNHRIQGTSGEGEEGKDNGQCSYALRNCFYEANDNVDCEARESETTEAATVTLKQGETGRRGFTNEDKIKEERTERMAVEVESREVQNNQNVQKKEINRVQLGDFGISTVLDLGGTKEFEVSNNGTRYAHTTVGTPYYLSPELCLGKPYSSKSDIWSLGVFLYCMIYNQLPFRGNNYAALVLQILQSDIKYTDVPVLKRRVWTTKGKPLLRQEQKKGYSNNIRNNNNNNVCSVVNSLDNGGSRLGGDNCENNISCKDLVQICEWCLQRNPKLRPSAHVLLSDKRCILKCVYLGIMLPEEKVLQQQYHYMTEELLPPRLNFLSTYKSKEQPGGDETTRGSKGKKPSLGLCQRFVVLNRNSLLTTVNVTPTSTTGVRRVIQGTTRPLFAPHRENKTFSTTLEQQEHARKIITTSKKLKQCPPLAPSSFSHSYLVWPSSNNCVGFRMKGVVPAAPRKLVNACITDEEIDTRMNRKTSDFFFGDNRNGFVAFMREKKKTQAACERAGGWFDDRDTVLLCKKEQQRDESMLGGLIEGGGNTNATELESVRELGNDDDVEDNFEDDHLTRGNVRFSSQYVPCPMDRSKTLHEGMRYEELLPHKGCASSKKVHHYHNESTNNDFVFLCPGGDEVDKDFDVSQMLTDYGITEYEGTEWYDDGSRNEEDNCNIVESKGNGCLLSTIKDSYAPVKYFGEVFSEGLFEDDCDDISCDLARTTGDFMSKKSLSLISFDDNALYANFKFIHEGGRDSEDYESRQNRYCYANCDKGDKNNDIDISRLYHSTNNNNINMNNNDNLTDDKIRKGDDAVYGNVYGDERNYNVNGDNFYYYHRDVVYQPHDSLVVKNREEYRMQLLRQMRLLDCVKKKVQQETQSFKGK